MMHAKFPFYTRILIIKVLPWSNAVLLPLWLNISYPPWQLLLGELNRQQVQTVVRIGKHIKSPLTKYEYKKMHATSINPVWTVVTIKGCIGRNRADVAINNFEFSFLSALVKHWNKKMGQEDIHSDK